MGRASNEVSDYGRAVSHEIRRELGGRKMSGRALAALIGKSEKYVWVRLNDELEFLLADLEAIADAFDMSVVEIMRRAEQSRRGDAQMHAARPDTAHLTARWWRHVVARAVHEVPGVEIVAA